MKPDAIEALHALAGEYVLGTLPPEQHAAIAERLSADPALRAAVDAWEARLLPLTELATAQPPSARLWGRIQRSLDELPAPARASQLGWWQRLGLWQGLSAAGLAASLLLAFTLLTTPAPTTRYLVVLVAPSSQAPGWVVQASDSRVIELIPLGRDAVPEGMALQFWTKGEQWQAPVSLGLVKPGEPYRVPLQSLPPLEANQLFELTLEKAGGSPSGLPTGPVKFIGRAVKVI
ncbi:anti-sigma factor domain-containing protein [Pseudomonas sp. CM27]|uniref:anti-sigma factor n=1 Tax=Pseudomonas sp. CM27 TaxID=2738452 RepID=UPI001556D2BE|nr:anti-sigma factor [Pseudomonas sp. CM27]NQD73839.1 RNA polymerase subunit sigma-70 [Pseudomonas sp. CM27]HEN8798409.1 anti-sigma factor [Pseudomonas putida]